MFEQKNVTLSVGTMTWKTMYHPFPQMWKRTKLTKRDMWKHISLRRCIRVTVETP